MDRLSNLYKKSMFQIMSMSLADCLFRITWSAYHCPTQKNKTYYHRQGRVENATKERYAILKNTCIRNELSCIGGSENGGPRTGVTWKKNGESERGSPKGFFKRGRLAPVYQILVYSLNGCF